MAVRSYTYKNFDIVFTQSAGEYTATASVDALPASRPAITHFTLPSPQSPSPASPLRDAGQPPADARNLRPVGPQPLLALDPQALGRELYDAVFGDGPAAANPIGALFDESYACLQEGERLRIRLDFDATPALAVLPWEYLCADGPAPLPLALSNRTPVLRQCAGAAPDMKVEPPLRVLVVVSAASSNLNLGKEIDELEAALSAIERFRYVKLDRLDPATIEGLQDKLRSEYHVVHFMGHGAFDSLLLDRQTPAENIALHLGSHPPRLAFLNACESAKGSASSAVAGMAQRLIAAGVPEVVAMQFPIGDKAAIRLSAEFYQSIAEGYPADMALAEARRAVRTSDRPAEWSTPVLYSSAKDSTVLDLPPLPALPDPPDFASRTVVIPAGRFTFGTSDPQAIAGGAWPERRVFLRAYCIGAAPVTNAEYAKFLLGPQPYPDPPIGGWLYGKPPRGKEDQPVVGISWIDAKAYCVWLSAMTSQRYRLPTEAEWERAVRDFGLAANFCEWTCTVWDNDAKPYDCLYAEAYDPGPVPDRRVAKGHRVVRGGPAAEPGSAPPYVARSHWAPETWRRDLGFRVVLDFPTPTPG